MRFSIETLSGVIASDFDRVAELYDQLQAPLSDSISRTLIRLTGASSSQKVLDIGTGTGCAALAAARVVSRGSVTGIDISEGMLKIARRKAVERSLTNLRFVKMDASSLKFADEAFDSVISDLGIPTHLFRETISESFRVLRPGGTFCFAEFNQSSPAWTLLSSVLSKYRAAKAPPRLARRRRMRRQIAEMSSEFPLSSITQVLKTAGFSQVQAFHYSFTMPQPPSDTYLRYLISREHLEYSAMSKSSKKKFGEEMMKRLEDIRILTSGKVKRQVGFWRARR